MEFKKGDRVIYQAFKPGTGYSSLARELEGKVGYVVGFGFGDGKDIEVMFDEGSRTCFIKNIQHYKREPDWRI
jgi:hypothetical protein